MLFKLFVDGVQSLFPELPMSWSELSLHKKVSLPVHLGEEHEGKGEV